MWYFLRHAATAANSEQIIQGRLDTPLSELGIQQVHELARTIQLDPNPEYIVCSPLQRAVQTANILGEALRIPVQRNELLLEWSLGEAEGGTLREYLRTHPGFTIDWQDMDFRYPKGETKRELSKRACDFVTSLRSNDHIPLVISHQAILNYCIQHALGVPDSAAMAFRLGNCGICQVKPDLPYGRLIRFTGEVKMPWDPPAKTESSGILGGY